MSGFDPLGFLVRKANPTSEVWTAGVEMHLDTPHSREGLLRWAEQARKIGMQVTVVGARAIVTGDDDQWGTVKMLPAAPQVTWVWDESLKGPADHREAVRRSGVWFAHANPVGGSKYAYHVTFANRLSTIAQRGLVPVGGRAGGAMGRGGMAGIPEARTFLTPSEGILYWYGKAEDQAHEMSDDPRGDGYTPIVLRVPKPKTVERDKLGERYSGRPSWAIAKAIPASKIEVWDGTTWRKLGLRTTASWIDTTMAFDDAGFFVQPEANQLANVGT